MQAYLDMDVGYVDPELYLRKPAHPGAGPMREVLWRLATRQLRPGDWKLLAAHWNFAPEHIRAIEHEYTGELLKFTELRSCVEAEVAVLGSPSLTVLMVSVDVRQHRTKNHPNSGAV